MAASLCGGLVPETAWEKRGGGRREGEERGRRGGEREGGERGRREGVKMFRGRIG